MSRQHMCPPEGLVHLDPAGLSSHLVHLPPALNMNPFHRGALHVGASPSHVSGPPSPGARVSPTPPEYPNREGALCSTEGWGYPLPLPKCQVQGKEPGKGAAGWAGSRGY